MIVAVNDRKNAITQHRLIVPFRNFSKKVKVIEFSDPRELSNKQIDVVIINRSFGTGSALYDTSVLTQLHQNGIKIVIDLDDYWQLPDHHPIQWREDINYTKWQSSILDNLFFADMVWTTNKQLQTKIKEKYPQVPVHIVRNALDLEATMWKESKPLWKKSEDKVHIGYVGGVTHYKDLDHLKSAIAKINKYHSKKVHWHHCGYNMDKAHARRVSDQFRYVFTSGRKNPRNYSVYGGLPFDMYGHFYDGMDISIAPLHSNEFNECKSELKVIEAGVKRCAFIGEDMVTYSRAEAHTPLELAHTPEQWYESIMCYVEDKDELEAYKEELHQGVLNGYSLEQENKVRLNTLVDLLYGNKNKKG